jgi:DNA recombination protein RmuC
VIAGLAIGFLVGILVAAAAMVALWQSRSAAQHAERIERDRELNAAESQVVRLAADLENEQRRGAERQMAWDEAREALTGQFATISAAALRDNNEHFLQIAGSRFDLAQQAQKGDLDNRTQSIEQLLAPLRDQLRRYEEGLRNLEFDRQHAYAGLVQQVKQLNESQDRLQSETRNLVTALRAPATRGRWGEIQLRRVMEISGMIEHCDFDEQVTLNTDGGRLRPDVVVHLAGGRNVIVDAKVPLQAFLEAVEATDEMSRKTHLIGHARQLRAHVDSLAKKGYSQELDFTPEYVIAFIPGDPLLTAAMEQDPSILEHAFEHHVILATPTSLIALLRTIAFGWQQESLATNAIEVQKTGRELYKRLSVFSEHLAKAGRSLGGAVDSYNKAVGSLERNVLPQARRFHDLGVGSAENEVPEPDQLDCVPRLFQARELIAGDPAESPDEVACEVVELDSPVRALPFGR